ncbi:hypothetical protein PQI07_28780 [Methylobacterium sp. 092160098-2]|nr:hypothetical protein [Methylobacterium sp. 092160098-2]MDE4914651.1 hypothetical protein [Methylobacterium sp. 092160098-2]
MPPRSAAPEPKQVPRRRACRAAIAVVALYALALQAVLGGANLTVLP